MWYFSRKKKFSIKLGMFIYVLKTTLEGRCPRPPHFTGREAEAVSSEALCPQSQS